MQAVRSKQQAENKTMPIQKQPIQVGKKPWESITRAHEDDEREGETHLRLFNMCNRVMLDKLGEGGIKPLTNQEMASAVISPEAKAKVFLPLALGTQKYDWVSGGEISIDKLLESVPKKEAGITEYLKSLKPEVSIISKDLVRQASWDVARLEGKPDEFTDRFFAGRLSRLEPFTAGNGQYVDAPTACRMMAAAYALVEYSHAQNVR